MKKILFFFILSLCSCKSITYSDVNPNIAPNQMLLPPMEAIVSMQNLEATYSAGSIDAVIEKEGESGNIGNSDDWGKVERAFGVKYKDIRVKDAINIFEKEIAENITNSYGPKKGYIELKLGYLEEKPAPVYTIPSMLTLSAINIFGFPANKMSQSLEVEVRILNNKKDLVKKYVEYVQSENYVAMWWGYGESTIRRKLAADNLKKALESIRKRINDDAKEIRAQLM